MIVRVRGAGCVANARVMPAPAHPEKTGAVELASYLRIDGAVV
jgi:hypothetical protein